MTTHDHVHRKLGMLPGKNGAPRIMPLLWIGPVLDPSGYGVASRHYVYGLRESGIPIKLLPLQYAWAERFTVPKRFADTFAAMQSHVIPPGAGFICIQHLIPDEITYLKHARYFVSMTTFETDSVPERWQLKLRAMDEIFTFSQFSRDVFEPAIRRTVTVIPHGVDVTQFCPDGERMRFFDSDIFVFGSSFDWSARKNPRALLTAYFRAFTRADDVGLVIKCGTGGDSQSKLTKINAEIDSLRCSLGLASDQLPRVQLRADTIGDEDLPKFYRGLDCYVSPTRGEGWGLTITEAMATALPVIVTGWSAITEYATTDNAYLLNYRLAVIQHKDSPNDTFHGGQKWAEVDVDHLIERMRYAAGRPEQNWRIGANARASMMRFTWDHACAQLAQRLRQIAAAL